MTQTCRDCSGPVDVDYTVAYLAGTPIWGAIDPQDSRARLVRSLSGYCRGCFDRIMTGAWPG